MVTGAQARRYGAGRLQRFGKQDNRSSIVLPIDGNRLRVAAR
jgi:hypothetical protein